MAGHRGAVSPRPAPPTRCAPQAPASGRSPSRCPSRCSPWPACPWCSTTSKPAPRYAGAGLSRAGPGAVQELPSHCAPAGARPEGDPADGLLPAPRGSQPLPGGGPAGIQDSHQVGVRLGVPHGPASPPHLVEMLSTPGPEPPFPRRYLQEYAALGTAGGIYHFRDQILAGGADAFFVLNADVCSEFPLQEMLDFRQQHGDTDSFVILGTTVRGRGREQRGCGTGLARSCWMRPRLGALLSPACCSPGADTLRSAGQQDAGSELRLHRGQRGHAGGRGRHRANCKRGAEGPGPHISPSLRSSTTSRSPARLSVRSSTVASTCSHRPSSSTSARSSRGTSRS